MAESRRSRTPTYSPRIGSAEPRLRGTDEEEAERARRIEQQHHNYFLQQRALQQEKNFGERNQHSRHHPHIIEQRVQQIAPYDPLFNRSEEEINRMFEEQPEPNEQNQHAVAENELEYDREKRRQRAEKRALEKAKAESTRKFKRGGRMYKMYDIFD
jgi:hypothetical protein